MTLEALAVAGLVLAAIPAAMCIRNLSAFRHPVAQGGLDQPVSVLIPARNEERSIGRAIRSVLANAGRFEVRVLDDNSDDGTAARVLEIARDDARVHLERGPQLARGWCGKQHACHVLAQRARYDTLLFMDADVELAPNAIRIIRKHLETSAADLVSGFPRQRTGSFLERLLIPLIHFVLLGFLPLRVARQSDSPSLAAGCGQLMVARRSAYEASGGHAAIRGSRHDGLQLPRSFRRAGFKTDLFDASRIASCRMYESWCEVWNGLAKNATEGMGSPGAIGVWTILLVGGHVLPLALTIWASLRGSFLLLILSMTGLLLALSTRAVLAFRFRQSWMSVGLHPVGTLLLVVIQWFALFREALGAPIPWKGREA